MTFRIRCCEKLHVAGDGDSKKRPRGDRHISIQAHFLLHYVPFPFRYLKESACRHHSFQRRQLGLGLGLGLRLWVGVRVKVRVRDRGRS